MLLEIIKFIVFSILIIVISKYALVETLRKFGENLNLSAKTIGNITGISTSVPELLTITASSINGLFGASLFNILSSNVINLIQYFGTILLNKNTSKLKNIAILFDMFLVVITIIIPILLIKMNILLDIYIVPLFVILYALFVYLNSSVHKQYLEYEYEDKKKLNKNKYEGEDKDKEKKKTLKYIIILIVICIALYIIGELLGNTLEKLCNEFNIPESITGILLGVITSVPELVTFFESQKYYKEENDKMLGVVEATNNLLTSNIMNLFIIQTIGILIVRI